MAADIFIYFEKGRKPSKNDIKKTLEDYTDGLATKVIWKTDRFFVRLPGLCRHPLVRVLPKSSPAGKSFEQEPRERWIEVWMGKDGTVDVMTRQADALTNNIATGYAKIVAKYWDGRLEF